MLDFFARSQEHGLECGFGLIAAASGFPERVPWKTRERGKLDRAMEIKKPVVAVVDDDSAVLKALTRLLRATGWEVQAFNSGQALLDSLPGLRFDCLIVDVQMPGMGGFELKRRLGQRGCLAPALFITAHDSPQSRATASQPGSLGLLIKPFSATALLTALSLRSLVLQAGPPEAGGQNPCPG